MKELSVHQTVLIVCVLFLGLKFINLPAFFASVSGADMWMSAFIVQLVDIIIVAAVVIMYYHAKKDTVYSLLRRNIGVVGAKAVMLVLMLFFFFKLVSGLKTSFVFYSGNIFWNNPYIMYAIPVCIFIFCCLNSGLRRVGRLCEVLCKIGFAALFLIILFAFFSSDFEYLAPVLQGGAGKLAVDFKSLAFSAGDALPLLMLAGRISGGKKFALKSLLAAVVCILAVTVFYLLFAANYGSAARFQENAIGHIGELPLEMYSLGKLDWLLVLAYAILSFIKLALISYAAYYSTVYFLGLKFQNKAPLFATVIIAASVPAFLPGFASISGFLGAFGLLFLLVTLLLPVVCALLALFGKKSSDTTCVDKDKSGNCKSVEPDCGNESTGGKNNA